ncbi:hypothetical protein [Blautia obeum]|uniref:Uncharacterized protein n=1 Tax=Blautia obeum TaxID=40520 RepID=A0A411ZUK9_9FIRM|nr:hypothetical protein [Blautia obeum]RGQ06511.1 hypothetical protein DWZ12_04810 [Blautia obeum]
MLIHTDYGAYIIAENVLGVGVHLSDKGEFNVVLYGSDGGRVLTTCKDRKDAEQIAFYFAHLIDEGKDEAGSVIGKNQYSRKGFNEAIKLIHDKKMRRAVAEML